MQATYVPVPLHCILGLIFTDSKITANGFHFFYGVSFIIVVFIELGGVPQINKKYTKKNKPTV